jgi:hypothetical protein
MHFELFGKLLNGFDSLQSFHAYFGFELGTVAATFGFHHWWFFSWVYYSPHQIISIA